jgi:hypothetical protein
MLMTFFELRDDFWQKGGAEGYVSLCWLYSLVGKLLG